MHHALQDGFASPRVTVLVVLSLIRRVRLQIYEIRKFCGGGKEPIDVESPGKSIVVSVFGVGAVNYFL